MNPCKYCRSDDIGLNVPPSHMPNPYELIGEVCINDEDDQTSIFCIECCNCGAHTKWRELTSENLEISKEEWDKGVYD